MKATDVIKDIAALIDRDGNFEVEVAPSHSGNCRCSRPITSVGGDGIGAIYLHCDINDVISGEKETIRELLQEVDKMNDGIAIAHLKRRLRDFL